jgi:uncharacterized membrane protein
MGDAFDPASSAPAAGPVASNGTSRPGRDRGLDVLRGIVILLMVIDHVRFFLSSYRGNPTDPAMVTPALFVTRWVTHFCAPTFMLLAGAGAWLSLGRGRSRAELSRYLVTRGAWLILLELTVARWGWQFNFDYGFTSALVFWALGWSMIALAGLVWLPAAAVGVVGVLIVCLHNVFDTVGPERWGSLGWVWTLLHSPGPLTIGHATFFVLYTLVPWVGVMAGGYAIAAWLGRPGADRPRDCLRLGLALTAAFFCLRALNVYGDPVPWTVQATPIRTLLSFLDTSKYPASLLFVLMTLGPAIAALPLLGRVPGRAAARRVVDAVETVGRVPLFFWLLHVPLIHALAVALSLARYGEILPWLVENPPAAPPPGYGYGLGMVYAVTALVIVVLYPLCRWYSGVKRRHRAAWLDYL